MTTAHRRLPTAFGLALAAVVLLATSCTVPPAATGYSQACAPPGTPVSRIEVTFTSAPAGSTLQADIPFLYLGDPGINPGYGTDSVTISDPVAGQTRVLTTATPGTGQLNNPDPGRCIHLTSTGGLTYQVVLWSETNPVIILEWATGFLPQPNTDRWGYSPDA